MKNNHISNYLQYNIQTFFLSNLIDTRIPGKIETNVSHLKKMIAKYFKL